MADIAIYPVTMAERDQTYDVSMQVEEIVDVSLDSSIQIINTDTYEGSYTVIPKANEETVLETRDKTMTDDVTVTKVPYFETHNESGVTVYIAMEV